MHNAASGAGISYSQLSQALKNSNCQLCALSQSRTQIVVDRGNPGSKVLFVGEAPGQNEDLSGKAFVGRSGRLLDQLLAAQGFITDKDGLIVNVVKCRPPKNRAPLPLEVQKCMPYLHQQIKLVKPTFIGLLGATALKCLFPDRASSSMKDQVGRFFEDNNYPGVQLMALYHPAYILRDPRRKPEMEQHLSDLCEAWRRSRGDIDVC